MIQKSFLLCMLGLAAASAAAAPIADYSEGRPQWAGRVKKMAKENSGKFRVLQIGDSHTAGDYFTDRLRKRLQQQWGDGGIGLVPPGMVKGQRTATVRYGGNVFQTASSRNSSADFPLGGIIGKTGGTMTVAAADGSGGMQRVTVSAKPVWPDQTMVLNGREIQAQGSGWQAVSANVELPLSIGSSMPWELGFINIENMNRGVTVSAMGINGAQLTHWSKWRSGWAEALSQTAADLVILAYGTNEAFGNNIDIAQTEQAWHDAVATIKRSLPEAGILIVGAPESLKQTGGACGVRPLKLTEVQQMQQRVAREEKVMYWPWQDVMGGSCSMKNWMRQGLAGKDGVHFSAEGYRRAADDLADSLIAHVR